MQYLFLDSNLFLQCRPLQDLDWDRICGREEVTLLIPSAVLAELDRHKSDGNSRRAQRARRALQFIDSILAAPDDKVLVRTSPAKVIAQFAPEISGDTSGSNDDSILLEVAEMARTRGAEAAALVTHDTNLKVKAKRKGLRFFPVPDDWLLPPEPDERDKRVRQMEEQVARLLRQFPVIEISVANRVAIELTVPDYAPLEPTAVTRLIGSMRARTPMKTDFSLTASQQLTAYSVFGRMHPPADSEIEKYQKEYREWEERLRTHLESFHSALRIRDAPIDLRVLVANTGSVPAEHIEVEIAVSEGLVLAQPKSFTKIVDTLLSRPRVPNPPEPRNALVDLACNTRLGDIGAFAPPRINSMGVVRRERDEFYLKEGKDTDARWIWAAEQMRHGKQPKPFDAKLGLQAQIRPSGGLLSVVVAAGNLPEAKRCEFPVAIRYVHEDTEAAAAAWLGLKSS